ncbi:MAG: tail fiber domain-containing protein [Myxococcota bacterium]|nr:tail fiber domain-containing protein [Myxococcota bacterium]
MSDRPKDDTLTVSEQSDTEDTGQARRPYEAPRVVSGDVFERLVLMTGSGPTTLCPSDIRLKTDIVARDGSAYAHLGLTEYTWKWRRQAETLYGLVGQARGVLAQEVEEVVPRAVHEDVHGYRVVDYGVLERCAADWSSVVVH